MKVIGIRKDGTEQEILPNITKNGVKTILTVKKDDIAGEKYDVIRISSELMCISAVEKGYLFFPADAYVGVIKCDLRERDDVEFVSRISWMPAAGICENKNSVFVMVTGGMAEARFRIGVKDNMYEIAPEFCLDGDAADENLVVEFYQLPGATYSDMAKIYRKHQIEKRNCVPIRERIKTSPSLEYAADAMEFRIRMGWKPVPTPVLHQTPETEPPMKVACDIPALYKLVDSMKNHGIEKAELCLVGWSQGGHDGRFPQNYPVDKRYGSDEDLKEFIKYAQKLGYHVVCHTNSVCAYEVADNWDKDALTHINTPEGRVIPLARGMYNNSGGLSGGMVYHLCAKTAHEKYAVADLPKISDYGFRGLHFIDELTSETPMKCYHQAHPVTSRKQGFEHYRKIINLAKSLFGGFQSECHNDYLCASVDSIMYTSFLNSPDAEKDHPMFDEIIPFWQLVYHGIILSNPTSQTVNYMLKDSDTKLKFIEFGGRPLMYLYSKFGEEKNWMGNIDLTCGTDEELSKTCAVLKEVYEEYEVVKHLQYEFMENHEKLSEGIYCTTYSDGTKITVDYNKKQYIVQKGDKIFEKLV